MQKIRIIVVALTAALAGASMLLVPTAYGACPADTVPPGNSEVDQYLETVPGSCGDRSPEQGSSGPGGSSGSGGGGDVISPATGAELEALGSDGQAAASLAAQTAPSEATASGRTNADPSSTASTAGPAAEGGSTAEDGSRLDGLTSAVTGDAEGSAGLLLPLLLGSILLAVAGAVALRRRHAA